MTRSGLIKRLKDKHSTIFIKDIERIVDLILGDISDALVRGDRVELRGFGSFSTRWRKPRVARNPKTGDKVPLGQRRSIYFRAGKDLRERVDGPNA